MQYIPAFIKDHPKLVAISSIIVALSCFILVALSCFILAPFLPTGGLITLVLLGGCCIGLGTCPSTYCLYRKKKAKRRLVRGGLTPRAFHKGLGVAIGTAKAGCFARSSYHAKKMNLPVRIDSAMTYKELSKAASKITEILGFSFEDDDGTPESLMEHVSFATLKRVERLFRTDPEAAKQYFLKMIDLRDAKPPSEASIDYQLNIANAPSPEFQPGTFLQQERDHSHNEVTQQLSSHQLLPQPGIPEGKSSELMLPHRIQKNNDIEIQSKVKYHNGVNKNNLSETEPKKQIVSLGMQLT